MYLWGPESSNLWGFFEQLVTDNKLVHENTETEMKSQRQKNPLNF